MPCRNIGSIMAMMVVIMCTQLFASANIAARKAKGEVLLFRRDDLATNLRTNVETSSK